MSISIGKKIDETKGLRSEKASPVRSIGVLKSAFAQEKRLESWPALRGTI